MVRRYQGKLLKLETVLDGEDDELCEAADRGEPSVGASEILGRRRSKRLEAKRAVAGSTAGGAGGRPEGRAETGRDKSRWQRYVHMAWRPAVPLMPGITANQNQVHVHKQVGDRGPWTTQSRPSAVGATGWWCVVRVAKLCGSILSAT